MQYNIIIRGPLGCGKTTVAKKLAAQLSAVYVSIDDILEENNLTEQKEDGYIAQSSFKQANEIACSELLKQITKDTRIIFDGNFYWGSQLDDLITRFDCPYYVFTLKAPLDVCIARDKLRENPHGEIAAKVVYEKTNTFDAGEIIDATKSVDDIVQEIVFDLPTE